MQKSRTNQKPILTPGYIQGGSSMSVWFPQVNDAESTVAVEFTPTIPHCSMATLIGLSIKVKLIRSLPERFKLDVHITPGTHIVLRPMDQSFSVGISGNNVMNS
nr:mitotic spindle-associated MMXD complex subunit MIP18-like [Columba livia]